MFGLITALIPVAIFRYAACVVCIMLAIIRLPNRYVFMRLKDSPLGVSCTVTGLIDGHKQLKVIRVVALPIRYDL